MSGVENEANQLVDDLQEGAAWADVAEAIELRRAVDGGPADPDAGRILPREEVKRRSLLVVWANRSGDPPLKTSGRSLAAR